MKSFCLAVALCLVSASVLMCAQTLPVSHSLDSEEIELVELIREADAGDAVAQTQLGEFHEQRGANGNHLLQAADWYWRAANQGYAPAMYRLALLYLSGRGVSRNQDAAVRLLRQSAARGYAPAVAILQRRSTTVAESKTPSSALPTAPPKSHSKTPSVETIAPSHLPAISRTQPVVSSKAAPSTVNAPSTHNNVAKASLKTSVPPVPASSPTEKFLASGTWPRNVTQFQWVKTAAEAGDAHAQLLLASSLKEGWGTPKNQPEAVLWYRNAARQGVPEAEQKLADIYIGQSEGNKIQTDGLPWIRAAAQHGYAPAQAAMGLMYERGNGVEQDYLEAATWYRRAADQGLLQAEYLLGQMYSKGWGVPRDMQTSEHWLRMGAEAGSLDAQIALAQLLSDPSNEHRDLVQAYAWFAIAGAAGRKTSVEALNKLAPQMSIQQISQAQTQALDIAKNDIAKNDVVKPHAASLPHNKPKRN